MIITRFISFVLALLGAVLFATLSNTIIQSLSLGICATGVIWGLSDWLAIAGRRLWAAVALALCIGGGFLLVFALSLIPPGSSESFASITGFAAAGMLILTLLISAIGYRGRSGESYSPFNHTVSELGEVHVSPFRWLFNIGVILGATSFVIHMDGVEALAVGDTALTLAARMGIISGIGGIGVGLLPLGNRFGDRYHFGTASVFFACFCVNVISITVHLFAASAPLLPTGLQTVSILIGAIFIAFFIAVALAGGSLGSYAEFPNDRFRFPPFLEWCSLVSAIAWILIVSALLASG